MVILECNNGTFGYNCEDCSNGCKDEKCEKFSDNGFCTLGCKPGYQGETCEGDNVSIHC